MISQGFRSPEQLNSFDERIDVLARELELSIKWERPSIILIVYDSAYARADAEAALESGLAELGQKIVRFPAEDGRKRDLASFICGNEDCANAVYFVEGLNWGGSNGINPSTAINLHREIFVDRHIRLIIWLTQNEAMDLAHDAPDFWALRHRVIEFTDGPRPEKMSEQIPEFAWQGIGEYTHELDDADAKISLRESLLTELPEGQESTSIRANLLLTLGILNWRKGNHAKADGLLREALEIATKIQDNWFEAECFNATALVKTDLGCIDEAIDAYKQAIRLAPEQIFAWNNLGNLCLKIERNDEAVVAFQKAIEYNPKDPVSWNGLGNVYYKISYIEDAIAAYRKSIEFAPSLAHPWNGLGEVYAGIGRINEAIAAYQKAADLNKRAIAPWLRLGQLFNQLGRNRDAIKAYQSALAIDPKNSLVWNDLGVLYLNTEAYPEASGAFAKAAELDHGFGWAHSNLGLCYAHQQRYKDSIPLYLRSIELFEDDKDKAVSWNRLGNVYRRINDYEHAITAYKMADLLNPEASSPQGNRTPDDPGMPAEENGNSLTSPESIRETGLPAGSKDQPGEIFEPAESVMGGGSDAGADPETGADTDGQIAEMAADMAAEGAAMSIEPIPSLPPDSQPVEGPLMDNSFEFIELEEAIPADAALWNEKGNVHFKAGAYEEAIAAYNKAIELDQTFGWPYSNLGLTYLTLGKYAQAILLYQKSIELLESGKEKAVSWNELGNAYRCIDDYNNAILAYQKADQLDPDTAGARDRFGDFHVEANSRNARVWNDLGRLFFKTGSYEEAVQAYCKAIELEPAFGWPYSNLALTLVYQGDHLAAVPLYKKSIDLLKDDGDRAISWNRLGNAYRKLNDYDRANAAYQQAVKLNNGSNSLLTRTRFSLLSNCFID